jgi:predicted transcriptional regulator
MPALHPVKKRHGTARELAEKWGVSPQTVRRYIAQPRAEYEAQSVERAKPWEALGISRATWYRRGKPDQWQRYARGFEVSEA